MILLLLLEEPLSRETNGPVQGDRQATVAAADHDETEYQLGSGRPRSAEAEGVVWHAYADADAAVCRHDLEYHVEHAEVDRVGKKVARIDGHNNENRDD